MAQFAYSSIVLLGGRTHSQEWMEGIIVPLQKGGDAKDIGNYRGIMLCSHVAKLFCLILKDRLSKLVEGQGILGGHRAGLGRKGRLWTSCL